MNGTKHSIFNEELSEGTGPDPETALSEFLATHWSHCKAILSITCSNAFSKTVSILSGFLIVRDSWGEKKKNSNPRCVSLEILN